MQVGIAQWKKSLRATGVSAAEAAATMRGANPKYIPREWMLVEAYVAAEKKDHSPLNTLYALFKRPYEEQPEMEEKYFRLNPVAHKVPGTGIMS